LLDAKGKTQFLSFPPSDSLAVGTFRF